MTNAKTPEEWGSLSARLAWAAKRARDSRRLSMRAVSAAAGLSETALQNLITSARAAEAEDGPDAFPTVRTKTIVVLAASLDVSLDWLLTGQGVPDQHRYPR